MDVLLVGGGGREAALAWRLARSPSLGRLLVTHPNPGFPEGAEHVEGDDPVRAAREAGVDLVVIGPEAPLCAGLVDRLREAGIPAFGPTAAAARLEGSKAFARRCMDRWGVPQPAWSVHADRAGAHAAVGGPCVVKADGLAAGKGVTVCPDSASAHAAIDALFDRPGGPPGGAVLVEERLEGEELSLFALCDGRRACLLPTARDHKRRHEGDRGPNTGGMGAFSPAPVDEADLGFFRERILEPVLAGMREGDHPFTGVLYAGLMRTPRGLRVLEFNVRFGDPECQVVVPRLEGDFAGLLMACARGELPEEVRVASRAAVCVVVCRAPYPGPVGPPVPIERLPVPRPDLLVFHAGTATDPDGRLLARGGRVVGITGLGPDLAAARAAARAGAEEVVFPGADWRRDIGAGVAPLVVSPGR